ncbi:MAG: hypothetical protein IKC37_00785 [Clostridia bacterium]|nr:hypothetical protein [Clostridia bacterium]
MKVKDLLAAIRLYGLDVLFFGLLARLLDGLSKKASVASADLFELVARKKSARAEKAALREKE